MSARSTFRARNRLPSAKGFLESLLDPIDRLSETIFSILILLTFTLAFRIIKFSGGTQASFTSETMNELLIGVLGAILAWGLIDGVMYALLGLFERSERHRLLQEIKTAESESEALEIISDELDYILEPISEEAVRQKLYASVYTHLKDSQPRPVGFNRYDFTGALGHVVVALIAVVPSLAPLLLLRHDPTLAIRVSNIVSFLVLFIVGYRWGQYTGANPWKTGLLLTAVAVVMVLVAIPLGG